MEKRIMEQPAMTRGQVIQALEQAHTDCLQAGMDGTASSLYRVLTTFDFMAAKAAAILGSKGGNTPVKAGSRPRGRPRKDAISETPPRAVD